MTRPPARTLAMAALLLTVAAGFIGLGVWQVERRSWKLNLIAEVNARVHAPVQPPPPPTEWPGVTAKADGYRHVRVAGTFLNDRETLVQAVTERGAGYWVLTPLRTPAGWTVLVNRGFVPSDHSAPATRSAGEPTVPVTVTGLLRLSEPGGAFLRSNAPAADRWYSRDVRAIATARGLGTVAPYFIDADDAANPGGYPVGGLTVVAFPNNHLLYCAIWFGMALLTLSKLPRLREDNPPAETPA